MPKKKIKAPSPEWFAYVARVKLLALCEITTAAARILACATGTTREEFLDNAGRAFDSACASVRKC